MNSSADRRPPSVLTVVLAPWIGMCRPAGSAAALAALRPAVLCAVFLANIAPLAAGVVLLTMWDATFIPSWAIPSPATMPASTPTSAPLVGGLAEIRSIGQVWRDWHGSDWIGPAEWIFLGVYFGVIAGAALLTFVFLPRVHRGGPLWRSGRRTLAAVVVGGGALTLATLIVVTLIVQINLASRGAGMSWLGYWEPLLPAIGIPLGVNWVLLTISAAVAGVRDEEYDPRTPPRCEGCGYDLTHRSESARCTECGVSVDSSLTPGLRRPGTVWERLSAVGRPRFGEWAAESLRIIMSPQEFYGRLRLRTDPTSVFAFARRTQIAISVLGLCFGFVVFVRLQFVGMFGGLDWEAMFLFFGLFGLWAPLACWAVHRMMAALLSVWWVFRDALPDHRWAAKAQAYESAYLWVFWAYWTALTASYLLFDDWVSQLPGSGLAWELLGMPPEVALVFGGSLAILVLWFLRYRWILRAIRWSSF